MGDVTAIAPRTSALPTQFDPENLGQAFELAKMLAKSNLLPTALRGRPEDVMITMLAGRELGLSTMQAIRGISVIEGKPTLNADLLAGLVQRHPEVCHYFRLVESTDEKATYETHRSGHSAPVRLTFTIAQARAANLTGKNNWKSWPAAMLRARCAAHLARAVYPDLVAGIYSDDEGEEIRAGALKRSRAAQVQAKAIEGEVVPPHDPKTGEVAKSDQDQRAEELLSEVAKAATLDALKALVPRLQALDNGAKERVRSAYGERQRALRAASVPPPEPRKSAEEIAAEEQELAEYTEEVDARAAEGEVMP